MTMDATPLLRAYATFRLAALARMDPVATQQRVLQRLIARARSTRFHRDHRLERVRTVADYQRAVPLRTYDDFWQDYWKQAFPHLDGVTWPGRIPYFANSSGTSSGVTKHIPVSRAMVSANRRAAIDLLVHHVANRPSTHILGGRNFVLGGSTGLTRLAGDVSAGDLSGIAAAEVPWWARPYFFPTGELGGIADWEVKTERLARESLTQDIRSISGGPSWILLFFEQLAKLSPERAFRLVDCYPKLEMIVHGGVSFAPYARRFAELLQDGRAETREVYPASEGFIAIADREPAAGLRLLVDNGLFFEFVPVEELDAEAPTRHWLGNAQPDVNYALVVTTCAGLWSYVVGDTVRLASLDPPRVFVTGRTSYSLSAFGEHLIGQEIERAVAVAAVSAQASVRDFSVGAVHDPGGSGRGHHLYLVEFEEPLEETALGRFATTLDAELCRLNADYAEHRRGDFNMQAPRVVEVAPGAFAAWMKERGKLGGQNKVPRVICDPAAFAALASRMEPSVVGRTSVA
jgi:hypothetical protein